MVEAALKRVDIVPLQVLIEASIVEVAVTENLRQGVEWFCKNNNVQGDKTGIGLLDFGTPGIAPRVPGLTNSRYWENCSDKPSRPATGPNC